MASKYAKQLQVPDDFAPLLKDFTREVLREQKVIMSEREILLYAARYFEKLLDKREGKVDIDVTEDQPRYMAMSEEELERYVSDIFRAADADGNGYLDHKEFKRIFRSMTEHLDLSELDVQRILAEADENDNGALEYHEFVPVAIEIIQSLRAQEAYKHTRHQRSQDAEIQARDVLLHGMPKDQIISLLSEVFRRADVDNSGTLSRSEFMTCIRDSDLGFTRKEINVLMSQVDEDGDGVISYDEFVPVCFEVLVQLFSNELIQTPKNEADLADFFCTLFGQEDQDGSGLLSTEQLKQLLRSADVGLTRIQITAIMAEAHENENGWVPYEAFANAVSAMVLSIVDFDVQHSHAKKLKAHRLSASYHVLHNMNRHEFESALLDAFNQYDEDRTGSLSKAEVLSAVQTALPQLASRELRAVLSLLELDPDGYASYLPIVDHAFQTLQWLRERDSLIS